MKIRRKGVVVLLMCQFLLITTLILLMTSFSAVYSQHKKVNKEIEYRKTFWLVEAGLECAFGLFATQSVKKNRSIRELTKRCGLPDNVEVNWILETKQCEKCYLVTSRLGYLSLNRRLTVHETPEYRVVWLKGSWRDF